MFKQFNFALVTVVWLLLFANLVFSQGNWEQILPPGPTTNQIVSVHFTDEQTGLSVGEQGTILKTTDGGETWCIVEIPWLVFLLDVYFPSPDVGYIVGQEGIILKTTDEGEGWSLQQTRFTNNLHRVRFRDDQNGWIIGEKGLILHTNDGGETWQQQITNTSSDLKGLAIIYDTSLCAVGTNETLLLTTDNGQNWQPIVPGGLDPNKKYHFNDVFFINDSLGWIGGDEIYGEMYVLGEGILMSTKNGGATWAPIKIEGYQYEDIFGKGYGTYKGCFDQVYFFDELRGIHIQGKEYHIASWIPQWNQPYYTEDGGKNWKFRTYGNNEHYNQSSRIFAITENKIILTGYRGEFRFSSDRGYTWRFPNHNCRGINWIFFGNKGKILAYKQLFQILGGSDKAWIRSVDFGKNWVQFTPQVFDSAGNKFEFFRFQNSILSKSHKDQLWTIYFPPSSDKGHIYRSDDLGLTWNWQKGSVDQLLNTNYRLSSSLPVFLSPDTIFYYILTQEGDPPQTKSVIEILSSFNGGKVVNSFKFNHLWNDILPLEDSDPMGGDLRRFISTHYFFDGRTGFLIGSEGNIIKTEDTGKSWKSINSGVNDDLWDITFIDRLTGYVVGNFGRILKTQDGGNTWRKTDSGTQDNVYSIVFKNNLEGWAGTESGLIYTKDGGETWRGIPMRYRQGSIRTVIFDDYGTGYAMRLGSGVHEQRIYKASLFPENYIALLVWKDEGVGVQENSNLVSVLNDFTLEQNYPNPFNPVTAISYQLSALSVVNLSIYNTLGQKVATLVSEKKPAGIYKVEWDAMDFSSGIYIYRLECDGQVKSRKMLLLQ